MVRGRPRQSTGWVEVGCHASEVAVIAEGNEGWPSAAFTQEREVQHIHALTHSLL
jgi:hypothetical protein